MSATKNKWIYNSSMADRDPTLTVDKNDIFCSQFAAGGASQKKRKEGMSISLPLIRRIDGSKTQP